MIAVLTACSVGAMLLEAVVEAAMPVTNETAVGSMNPALWAMPCMNWPLVPVSATFMSAMPPEIAITTPSRRFISAETALTVGATSTSDEYSLFPASLLEGSEMLSLKNAFTSSEIWPLL